MNEEELRMALASIICSEATILWILSGFLRKGNQQDLIRQYVEKLHNYAETLIGECE